jgi:predicted permease
MKNLKFAFRTLAKTPLLTSVALLSLALGIGANASIYSVFEQMLLRALPVQEAERLVNFEVPGPHPGSDSCGQAGGCDEVLTYPMLRDLQRYESRTLAGIAGHVSFGASLGRDGRTSSGTGLQVTGSYFPLLGVKPALGRILTEDDDRNIGEHRVAVLSHQYWENELGADPGILNQTLQINAEPMTVVGVAAAGFTGTTLGTNVDVFVPMTMRTVMNPWFDGFENRRWYWVYAFARLAPGVTIEEARAEMNGVYNGIINEVDVPLQTALSEDEMARFRAKELVMVAGARGQSSLHEEVSTPLQMLLVITVMVLLIACANVANLLLARGAARGQEMAIRGAIGAGRFQMMRQLMTESLLLAVTGGVASLLVAYWTLSLLPAVLPPSTTEALTMQLRPQVILFTASVALGAGFLFGLYPAVFATRADLATSLRAGTKSSGDGAAARFRGALVTGQIALSMILLVAAGLFIRSLGNISSIDLGLNAQGIVSFNVSPGLSGYGYEEATDVAVRIEERVSAVPGVTAVTASLVPVLSGSSWGNNVSVEGFEWSPGVNTNSRYTAVGPGYFGTMQVPLLAGREFTDSDVLGAPKVAIINEAFARKFGLDPRGAVGKFMATGSGKAELDMEIVGIVQDAKYSDVKDPAPALFSVPYRQLDNLGGLYIYARTASDPAEVLGAIPDLVAEVDGNVLVSKIASLDDTIRDSIVLDRLISTLSAAFAALATILAAVGLYGVLTYSVTQRTREIGIRMALGAGRTRVRSMVLGQVSRMVLIGGVVGLASAYFLGRFAEALLFGLDGSDPLVLGTVAVIMGGVAMLAAYLPARRASVVDPMTALRYD